jgi:tetratricopeptide (TPR) repeat protein
MSATEQTDASLAVRVVNGNLMFVRQPLILGHYRSMALSGTERVMDRFLDGALQTSLELGRYADRPGTSEVFVNTGVNRTNPLQPPRPEAVIVVGLGEEGSLDPTDLVCTVCQGVIAWAQRRRERPERASEPLELAATLMGSGGTGMSAGQSALLVLRGVLEANERLARAKRPGVRALDFIELYLDRATEAWRALSEQSLVKSGPWRLHEAIEGGPGALRRPLDAGYRGAAYDLITARTVKEDGAQAIAFILDTKRARTEVHAHAAQLPLLQELTTRATSDLGNDAGIGRTLFRLLVPVELESSLVASSQMLIEVDGGTAGIPWEMLDAGGDQRDAVESPPWAIRSKLLRKLQTSAFRPQVTRAAGITSALVIGEPACDPARYPRLPTAQAEAQEVAACLEQGASDPANVRRLFSPDPKQVGPSARAVIEALLERDWTIVHITGHGEPPELAASGGGDPRGVVLSNGIFLGPAEIRSLRVVPDLVFVNCCHLAQLGPGPLLDDRVDRPRFAGTLAESLIAVGVRCVIAAGWAVEDGAATAFATTFYQRLTGGSRFIDAVADAREASRQKGGNTWAAYQCYGDPDFTLGDVRRAPASGPSCPVQTFPHVASPVALGLTLETLTVNSRYDRDELAALPKNLACLESRFAERWGDAGSVAEAFGAAWAECDRARAITWYQRALRANDGGASLRAAEQLGNLRVRVAAAMMADADAAGADQEVAAEGARVEIQSALELLQRVNAIAPSSERESLCGSAWKRLAMIEGLAGAAEPATKAIAAMKECYLRAEDLARKGRHPELFYPALNALAAQLIVDAGGEGWPGFDPSRIAEIRASLEAKKDRDPDFWSWVGLIDLRFYEAVARSTLAADCPEIEAAYVDLHERDGSRRHWSSVRDQLRFVLSARRSLPDADRRAGQTLLTRVGGFAAPSPARPTVQSSTLLT